jgi:hypothetical protein
MKKIIFLLLANILVMNAQTFDDEDIRDLIKCGTSRAIKGQSIIPQTWDIDINGRPILLKHIESKNGKFLLHYNIEGENAVPNLDLNNNSIPDYIDTALVEIEKVFRVECEELGYNYQLSDSGWGGSNATDIYFLEMGKGEIGSTSYGFTLPDLEIAGSKNSNPRFTSHILVDNDFSPKDSTIKTDGTRMQTFFTTGADGLRVTLAHEFHHVVQNIYGNFVDNGLLHEMTSTYMESRVYPEIKDYFQYVKGLFKNFSKYPFGLGETNSGYRYAIFGIYLKDKFGDGTLKHTWELSSKGLHGIVALDSALNSNFSSAFCDFASWCYYTGKRTGLGESFKDASTFPDLIFEEKPFIFDSKNSFVFDLLPYEIKPFRIITPNKLFITHDTLDYIITSTDFEYAMMNAFSTDRYNLTIYDSNPNNEFYFNIPNTVYYFNIDNSDLNCYSYHLFKGINSECPDFAFPNPYDLSFEGISLPVECSILPESRVQVDIYDIEHKSIYSKLQRVVVTNGKRTVLIQDFPDNISSGNYIFITSQEDKKIIGKFSIIKKY